MKGHSKSEATGKSPPPIPAPPESNQLAAILTKHVDLAITGEKSAKDALDMMHTELTKLLAQRGK